VLLLKSDAERIATSTNQQINVFADQISKKEPYIYEMHKNFEGVCIFLQNNRCTIYAQRPLICRFYPFELSTDEKGIHTFSVTGECLGVRRPSNGVGKNKLDKLFFDRLLELAFVELNGRSL